jgi:zinc protease
LNEFEGVAIGTFMTDVKMHTLSNGCRVLLRETPGNPVLSMRASVRWGARDDTPAEAGQSNLMARLLTKGTTTRSSRDIAEIVEGVGGSIEPFCSHDALGIATQTVSDDWPVAVDLLTDCLFSPAFDSAEFDKERSLTQAEILRAEDDKFACTYKRLMRLLYEGYLYDYPPEGEVETVARLTRDGMAELHNGIARPDKMLIVVVGNVPETELLAELEKRIPGDNSAYGLLERRVVSVEAGAGAGESREFERESEQGYVTLGYLTPRPGCPENAALLLISGVLGEGLASRLFSRLRDRDHLAYAIGSMIATRDLASHMVLYIGTQPSTIDRSREAMLREVDELVRGGVTEEEINRARNYILGKHLASRQTNSALAGSMASGELMGLGWNWAETLPERLRKTTVEDMHRVAAIYMHDPAISVLRPIKS